MLNKILNYFGYVHISTVQKTLLAQEVAIREREVALQRSSNIVLSQFDKVQLKTPTKRPYVKSGKYAKKPTRKVTKK